MAARPIRSARRKRLITEINFVPFIDIVLVLLVIFMMTASFLGTQEAGLDLRLPPAVSAQARDEPLDGIVVSILSDGRVYVDDREIAGPDLVRQLASRAASRRTQLAIIRADRAVPYERVAYAIDAAKLAGLSDLALATELDPGSRPRGPVGEER
ncbi:MAG: biopolymer transporter ExbD [Armatimonadetes bacterium]|nr:biopolymer transporter ExbD [Armatimonadota bacterium]